MKKAFVLASAMVLSACETAPGADNGNSLLDAIKSRVEFAPTQAAAPAAQPSGPKPRRTVRLKDTDLNKIFTKSNTTQWPRIALTINKVPPSFLRINNVPTYENLGDCLNISMTVWKNAKTSKKYDDIDFCGDDIVPNLPFIGVGYFPTKADISKRSTGMKRTQGPNWPRYLWPTGADYNYFLMSKSLGTYYLGSVMHTLGYDWNVTDERFWVVSLPTEAEVEAARRAAK